MPPLFWMDFFILYAAAVILTSLTLIALSLGPRETLNRYFAVFTGTLAAWAFVAVTVRLSLWTGKGNALLLTELTIPPYTAGGPLLLLFTVRYLQRPKTWTDKAAWLGLALLLVLTIPLFQGHLLSNPRLDPNGTMLADISPVGAIAGLIPIFFMAWSLVLFWQERGKRSEAYMISSVFLFLAGIILGGVLQVSFPIGSVANITGICILAYGVLSRQLFNPLHKRTIELQEQMAERTKADEALRNSETRLRSLLMAIPDIILTLGPQGELYEAFAPPGLLPGFDQPELAGKTIHDVLPPPAANRIMQIIHEVITKQKVTAYEYHMQGRFFQARVVPFDVQGSERILWLSRDITELKQASEQLVMTNIELAQAYDATLEGWSRALELRERETAGHSQRVVEMTIRLAKLFSIKDDRLLHIRRGTLLHDIGKLGIPDSILLKPGPLTDEEWKVMRQHPVFSYQLIQSIPYLHPAMNIPYYHHEKWDGSGYPLGLIGEEIPLEARLFAVVDVWDALTSERPYRPAWSEGKACEHLREQTGKHFDPRVVDAFFKDGFPCAA